MDVCSVKIYPMRKMKNILPKSIQILGTHPLFGPQSGKNGLDNLQIVLCRERISDANFRYIKNIFSNMGLSVKETSAKRHDEVMAYTQALTHFFSRAAANTIPFEDFEFITPSARRLRDIINEVKDDTRELFIDIQTLNPYAGKIRNNFLKELNRINKDLWKNK